MRIIDLKKGLQTNPNVGISYIIGNNPDAVADRLQSQGFTVGGVQQIWETINELIERKQWRSFVDALSVPYLYDGVDPAEARIVLDTASGFARTSEARSQGIAKSQEFGPQNEDGNFDAWDSNSGSDPDGSNFANSFNQIATGIASLWSTWSAANGAEQVYPVDMNGSTAAAEAAAKAQREKTARTIMIVVGSILALVLGYFAYRALKKK